MATPSSEELRRAHSQLDRALGEHKTDIVRDATIQRFEFCIELAWKTAKRHMGTASTAPRVIVREMAQQGLIHDASLWLEFLEYRNLASHTYHEPIADKVYDIARQFLPEGQKLLAALEKL